MPATSAPAEPAAPARLGETEAARAIVTALGEGRFGDVVARFDDTMTVKLPAERLRDVWVSVTAKIGKLLAVEDVTRERRDWREVVRLRCRFERDLWVVRVVFDPARRVSGLWMAPEPKPWTPPDYAATDRFVERAVEVGAAPSLRGVLTVPAGRGLFPLVVLVHGSGPHDEDESIGPRGTGNKPFKDIAWGLGSRGVAVLRYVKRSEAQPDVYGEGKAFTLDDEVTGDACAAVHAAQAAAEIDKKRLFVLGHSLGAAMAPRIAKKCTDVAGLVLLAGPTRSHEEILLDQYRYLAAPSGLSEAEIRKVLDQIRAATIEVTREGGAPTDPIDVGGHVAPRSYWLDLVHYDPAKEAGTLHLPMLVLQGARDYQVKVVDHDGWKRALAGRADVAFRLYPDLNHHFISGEGPSMPSEYDKPGHVAREVIDDIARWVRDRRL